MLPEKLTSALSALRTLLVAIATVVALHLALGGGSVQASAYAGCSHGGCQDESTCIHVINHDCCFASGTCEPYSCFTEVEENPCE